MSHEAKTYDALLDKISSYMFAVISAGLSVFMKKYEQKIIQVHHGKLRCSSARP